MTDSNPSANDGHWHPITARNVVVALGLVELRHLDDGAVRALSLGELRTVTLTLIMLLSSYDDIAELRERRP